MLKLKDKMINLFFVLALGGLVYQQFFKQYASADGNEAFQAVSRNEAVVLDVREEDEIKQGMIKGAIWFPLSRLNSHTEESIKKIKELTQNKKLYVYCRSGKRSDSFLKKIEKSGLKGNNLGGYDDLLSKGLPKQVNP